MHQLCVRANELIGCIFFLIVCLKNGEGARYVIYLDLLLTVCGHILNHTHYN